MYLRTLVVLPCLLAGVFATTHNLKGSFSSFKAESMKSENHAVGDLYSSCKEFDQGGDLVSIGEGCVAILLRSTYQVLSAAAQDEPVVIIQNGTVLDKGISNGESLTTGTDFPNTGLMSNTLRTIQEAGITRCGIARPTAVPKRDQFAAGHYRPSPCCIHS
jgi:hypothetical protein